jgi:hypothetical protein
MTDVIAILAVFGVLTPYVLVPIVVPRLLRRLR